MSKINKEGVGLETLVFSCFLHILVLVLLLRSENFQQYLEKLDTTTDQEKLLLVQLETDSADEFPHPIISDSSQTGSGFLDTQDKKQLVHLQGKFQPKDRPNAENQPSEKLVASQERQSQSQPNQETENTATKNTDTPPNPQKDGHLRKKQSLTSKNTFEQVYPDGLNALTLKQQQNRLAIETENSTNFRFYINKDGKRSLEIASHKHADFFLELRNKVSQELRLYASAGTIVNYYYLKPGSSRALASINKSGKIRFHRIIKNLQSQEYLEYLVEKILSTQEPMQNIPASFFQGSQDAFFVEVEIIYTGSPLYQWWLTFNFDAEGL